MPPLAHMSVLACPGCSMFNLFRFQFRDPDHCLWAALIVLGAAAIPLLMYIFGFRLGEKRIKTRQAAWGFAFLFFVGWYIMGLAGFYSPNFAVFLLHWLYFPLVVQWNALMVFAWGFPPLLIISGLIIPAVYCWFLSKAVLAMDRRIRGSHARLELPYAAPYRMSIRIASSRLNSLQLVVVSVRSLNQSGGDTV